MKLNSLQILRAFAALSVLVTHVFQKVNYKPFGEYFISGQYGVDIFFILSGFLIFLTVKESTVPIEYVKKRLFRIYPLYLLSLFFYIIVYTQIGELKVNVKELIQNILMFPWSNALGYRSLIIGVAWSTVFEMFFYFIFFIIILLRLSKNKIFIIIPILFIGSKFISKMHIVDNNTPFLSFFLSLGESKNLFMFLAGCVISYLFINKKLPVFSKKTFKVVMLVSLISYIIIQVLPYNYYMSFIFSLLLFVITCQVENYFILNPSNYIVSILILLGNISYSIYIFHILFIDILIYYFSVSNIIILLISAMFLTIIVSTLTYKYVEKPFINLAKK